MGKGFGMEKQGSDISLYLVPSTETSVTAADGSIQVTWGKNLVWKRRGLITTSREHRHLCYSRRCMFHTGKMWKGFGMEQKGTDNNVYRAQKPLLQPQMAP
jgi:hypothetical protein